MKIFFRRIGLMLKGMAVTGALSLAACQGQEQGQGSESSSALPQLTAPEKGEEIIVLKTTMGYIKLRVFPDEAPKAVENFITHARNGYYDGVIFHRIIENFMIQGGDPDGTGSGGESIWGGGFGYEKNNLRHFKGALAMAHSSLPDSNGSQFYIVQNSDASSMSDLLEMQDEPAHQLLQQRQVQALDENGNTLYWRDIFPTDVLNEYIKSGGSYHLDLQYNLDGHTVFGHVIEGMDVVDAIAAVPVDGSGKPDTDVVIERVEFEVVE